MLCLLRRLRLLLKRLLHCRPRHQPIHPRLPVRIPIQVLLQIPRWIQEANHGIPRQERQIRIAALAPHQVLLALQARIQHLGDALDLVLVAVLRRLDLLMMIDGKPGGLAEVGALPGHLKHQVLVLVILVRGGFRVQLIFRVVVLDEVLDDGAGLPEGDAGVGVLDRRGTGGIQELYQF